MKQTKMLMGIIIAFIGINFMSSCNRIDAGHVGIKVQLYGSEKGVQDITECTGWVFYNPASSSVYEFPTFIQHKEYTGENSFAIQSQDGTEFIVSPIVNYSVVADKVPAIFKKYRRDLEDIEDGFLKTAVFEAYRIVANSYKADALISSRQEFDAKVKKELQDQLTKEGFLLSQFTSTLVYPEPLKNAINLKNKAVQEALMTENRVKQAKAQADIQIATAEGNAKSMILNAEAEAKANQLRQSTLTTLLIQQQWIEKWNGVMPSTQLGSNQNLFMPIK